MVQYLDNNKNSGFNQWMAGKQKTDGKPSKFSGFFWWMIIFLLAWWLFSTWFAPKKNVETKTAEPTVVENVSSVPVTNINNDKVSANVQGLRVSKIELKGYKQDRKHNEGKNISLLAGDKEFAEVGMLANGTTAPTAETVWKSTGSDGQKVMTWRNGDGVNFKRTIVVKDYVVTITDEIKNNSGRDVSFAPYARMNREAAKTKAVSVATGGVAFVNSDIERNGWVSLDKKSYVYQTTNGFAGFEDQYWETIMGVNSPDQTIRMKKTGNFYQTDASAAPVQVSAGKTVSIETKLFAGPRDSKILAGADITGLSDTMDYGWFWFLSQPMLWALNSLNVLVMNYGLAIILLTLVLRGLMWPLTRKSYTSMAAMQKMQPELQKIQKLYANDKMRLQMEMMKLYQTHKTSPMSGCLPMLLQIPIFFALYKALLISIPMRQAGFLWIQDLSLMDPYFILPILMGATMWWQQHLQGTGAQGSDKNDPMAQTQKVMKWMPILFTAMFAWMPAGLVLYWTVSNMFGIMQMYIIKRKMKK